MQSLCEPGTRASEEKCKAVWEAADPTSLHGCGGQEILPPGSTPLSAHTFPP